MSRIDDIVKLLLEESKERLRENPQVGRKTIMYSIFKELDKRWFQIMEEEE